MGNSVTILQQKHRRRRRRRRCNLEFAPGMQEMVGEERAATGTEGIRNKGTLGVVMSAKVVDLGVQGPIINMSMLLLLKVAPERQFNPS